MFYLESHFTTTPLSSSRMPLVQSADGRPYQIRCSALGRLRHLSLSRFIPLPLRRKGFFL